MLVLTRKAGEQILIGDNIQVTLVRVRGNQVRIGIDAPRDVRVVRGELGSFDSKQEDGNDSLVNDREEVFAHPESTVIQGRARISGRQSDLPVPGGQFVDCAAKPHGPGQLRRASDDNPARRAPLAGFVSAT